MPLHLFRPVQEEKLCRHPISHTRSTDSQFDVLTDSTKAVQPTLPWPASPFRRTNPKITSSPELSFCSTGNTSSNSREETTCGSSKGATPLIWATIAKTIDPPILLRNVTTLWLALVQLKLKTVEELDAQIIHTVFKKTRPPAVNIGRINHFPHYLLRCVCPYVPAHNFGNLNNSRALG